MYPHDLWVALCGFNGAVVGDCYRSCEVSGKSNHRIVE